MKAIAVVTMSFLPVTGVATIMGSSYFSLDSDTQKVVVARNFKTFWFIAMPLTVVVFLVHGLWYWHLSGQPFSRKCVRQFEATEK